MSRRGLWNCLMLSPPRFGLYIEDDGAIGERNSHSCVEE